MPSNEHIDFMRHALDEGRTGAAAGNPAIGSVIIRGGQIIARGHNTVASTCDPTCHAETVAIRHICQAEQVTELPGTTLYTTMEPCPMCMWHGCSPRSRACRSTWSPASWSTTVPRYAKATKPSRGTALPHSKNPKEKHHERYHP